MNRTETLRKVLDVYKPRADGDVPKHHEAVTKRGFVELIVDLGDKATPDDVLLKALDALQELSFCTGYAVMAKQRRPGFYAHLLFEVAQFVAVDKAMALSTNYWTMATALEDFPTWALNAEGGRAHVFFGVGDPEERVIGDRRPS